MKTSLQFVCLLSVLSWPAALASAQLGPQARVDAFANPLDVAIADPHVLLDGGTYYLYGTTNVNRGFRVWSSQDLVNWQARGFCYEKTDQAWAQARFWAPCVIRDGDRYLLYYNAVNNDAQGHRICVAQASSPLGPFTDIRAPLWDPGYAVIDADVFLDTDGRAYLFYSKDISQNPVSEIWVVRLGPFLAGVTSEPTMCIGPQLGWEGSWTEAPHVFKHGPTYVLLYSGTVYSSPGYSIGYATAPSPTGPWTRGQPVPILARTPHVSGPGHCALVDSPDGRERFIVYHSHQSLAGGAPRQLAIDRFRAVPDAQTGLRLEVDGPTHLPQPLPSGARGALVGSSDEFDARQPDRSRWIVVNEDPSLWRLDRGRLILSTRDGDVWGPRFDLTNLFLQHAPQGDFDAVTWTDFKAQRPNEQAFIIVWQDHANYIRLGNVFDDGRRWQLVRELGGEPASSMVPNTIGDAVWMRISRRGRTYTGSVSYDGRDWYTIGPPQFADFTEVKIGIGAACPGGSRSAEAAFDFFRVTGPTPAQGPRLGSPSAPRP